MRIWIKRAVGAAALAGGLVALGGAAQAHAGESAPASRPARSAGIDAGACGVVSLGGSQAGACASTSDAVDVKVHVRHAPRASVQRTRRQAARQVRSTAAHLRATVPAVRATAQLGRHAAQVDASADANVGDTNTALARLAVRHDRASGGAPASHGTIDTAAAITAATNLGAKDGAVTVRPAAAVDLTVGTNGDSGDGSQLDASAQFDASADLRARTRDHGITAGAAADLSGNLAIVGKKRGVAATADARLSAAAKPHSLGARAAGHADASLNAKTGKHGTTASAGADIDAGLGTVSGGANGRLSTQTKNDGGTATTGAGIGANLDNGTVDGGSVATNGAGVGLGIGGLRTVLQRGTLRPSGSEVAGSGGVLDGLVTAAPVGVVPGGLGELATLGDQPVSGADPGQAAARGLRALGATVDRPILGSRSPLALGSSAVPGAVAPSSQGAVAAARLAAARAWAGITAGAGVAAGGQVPPVPVRALSAKPARMLAMTGGHAFPLLWLGLAVLLTGMVTLARARSMAL